MGSKLSAPGNHLPAMGGALCSNSLKRLPCGLKARLQRVQHPGMYPRSGRTWLHSWAENNGRRSMLMRLHPGRPPTADYAVCRTDSGAGVGVKKKKKLGRVHWKWLSRRTGLKDTDSYVGDHPVATSPPLTPSWTRDLMAEGSRELSWNRGGGISK